MSFDESYNMREAIDFLSERLGVREKLIQSAKQFSEKVGAQKFSVTVKRFEDLYADFIRLYQPIFDKMAGHREVIQRDIETQKDSLTGVLGMIQVAKGVEVLADRVRELETEAKGIETSINEKTRTLDRIDELLNRTGHKAPDMISRQSREEMTRQVREDIPDLSVDTEEFLLGPREPVKAAPSRKSTGR